MSKMLKRLSKRPRPSRVGRSTVKGPTDRRAEFSISRHYFGGAGEWRITWQKNGYWSSDDPIVWKATVADGDLDDQAGYPAHVRAAYEDLIEYDPTAMSAPAANVVEFISDPDENAFDQPCAFGHRVDGHAVYCHNQQWLYAPRKCHRSQSDASWKHEDCPGFRPNAPALSTEEQVVGDSSREGQP